MGESIKELLEAIDLEKETLPNCASKDTGQNKAESIKRLKLILP